MAVGFCQQLVLLRQPPLARWLAHAPLRSLYGLAAGLAAQAASDESTALQAAVAAAAAIAVDLVGNSVIIWARGADVRNYVSTAAAVAYVPFLLYLPIVWAIIAAYDRAGVPAMALVLGPALLMQYFFNVYRERAEALSELSEANLSFALGMMRALEAADPYTAGHSTAVGVYARDLAVSLGFTARQAALVQLAALLHDVGKIGVPDAILRKPGRLDQREWEEIRRHPVTGEEIAREVPALRIVSETIRHHHERPDGTGYPDGLAGPSIPQASLIVGVADAYSAMTQPRAYRDARPPEEAVAELARCAGTQFDEGVVQAFVELLTRQDATLPQRLGPDVRARAPAPRDPGRAGQQRPPAPPTRASGRSAGAPLAALRRRPRRAVRSRCILPAVAACRAVRLCAPRSAALPFTGCPSPGSFLTP